MACLHVNEDNMTGMLPRSQRGRELLGLVHLVVVKPPAGASFRLETDSTGFVGRPYVSARHP